MSGLEIIGGAVAIIQLLEYGKRARSCFLDLVKKADNPAESLEELSNYVESIIDHAKSIKAESSELAPIGVALRRCIKNSLALEAMLKKIRLDIAKNGRGKSKGRIWMVATWKWREKEIENAWNEIHDSITTLQFFVSCGNRNILHRIEGGLGSLKLPRENILRPSGSVPDLRIVPSDCLQTDPHSRADSFANMVLSRYSTVPTRNPYFVGRRKLLAHMTRILQPGDEYMIRTAIYGLGGIGYVISTVLVSFR
ncbi:hypothetical protein EV356DRAFT_149251 [Viridothelium virens]|uniref:Uncharacterized protein n=1 Tax=Viridothelium virens TaxID=1048519 RepID=A0A6A6H9W2_VIRVR|nr:hypothetical protein EV356DRAFT_149251 [Viridothelium virens]